MKTSTSHHSVFAQPSIVCLALSLLGAIALTAMSSAAEPASAPALTTAAPVGLKLPTTGLALAAAGVTPTLDLSTTPATRTQGKAPTSNAPTVADTTTNAVAKPDTSRDTYYLNDYLSTTIGTVDAAGEIDQMEIDSFGAPLAAGRPALRYTGKPYDEDMGAYIFPARNYRPEEMRWMSADPLGFPDGTNNHVYCPNPLTQIDPMGLATISFSSYTYGFSSLYHEGNDTPTVSSTMANVPFTGTVTATYIFGGAALGDAADANTNVNILATCAIFIGNSTSRSDIKWQGTESFTMAINPTPTTYASGAYHYVLNTSTFSNAAAQLGGSGTYGTPQAYTAQITLTYSATSGDLHPGTYSGSSGDASGKFSVE